MTPLVSVPPTTLSELAGLFLKLGATAFGGPAVHIAMMREEVVKRRKWLDEGRFMDLVGATNLIPGPSSTELAIHIGWERRRWAGLLVAGLSFIVPAMSITGLCAWAYVRFGGLPQTMWILYGIKPVMIAVVMQAIWGLIPTAAKTTPLRALGLASAVLVVAGMDELLALALAGAASALLSVRRNGGEGAARALAPFAPALATSVGSTALTLPSLFGVFAKIGSVLYGSGYVLLAFLRAELVERLGWLSEAQLIDAVAVGQVTPGPVFTTATFIGYVLAGPEGALVATAGIFLPAFVFVALSGPLIPRLRASKVAGAFLDGVNVASLVLMMIVTAQLGRAAVVDLPTALLALGALLLLGRFRVSSTWLVALGALAGVLTHALSS